MADNVTLDPMSGGATVATDECTVNGVAVQVPRGKVGFGVDGAYVDVSASNPLPVTAASLPLPTGAATDASLATTNTSLASIDAKLTACNTGAVVIASGTVAATQSGSWTVTGTGGTFPVTDSGGSLTVDAPVATPAFVRLSNGTAAVDTLPVSGTFWQATQPVSLASVPSHNVTNAGTFAVQATQSGTWNVGTVTTVTTVSAVTAITNALPAGSNIIGKFGIDQTTPGTTNGVQVNAALPAGTNTIGNVLLTSSATVGGWTPYSLISAASTNATNVKASAGKINGYAIFNTTSSALYVKFYDSATAPTAGSGTPVRRLMIPANGGVERSFGEQGLVFSSGIGFTITGASGDSDTTAVTSGAVLLNLDYK